MIKGLSYPLQIGQSGRFLVKEEDDKIRQNLEQIANTSLRERFNEPNNGTVTFDALFRIEDANIRTTIVELLQNAFNQQEPRVICKVIEQRSRENTLEGKLVFDVTYIRKDTRTAQRISIEVR